LFVVVTFLALQLSVSPFRSNHLNRLEVAGLVVAGISIYMGYFTYFEESSVIVSLVIISINICWGVYLLAIVLSNNTMLGKLCGSFCGFLRVRSMGIREVEV
jgi:hypothetical protein